MPLHAHAASAGRKQQRGPRPRHSHHPRHALTRRRSGFRDFILRGDVVSLAVAVVVGNSFTALVRRRRKAAACKVQSSRAQSGRVPSGRVQSGRSQSASSQSGSSQSGQSAKRAERTRGRTRVREHFKALAAAPLRGKPLANAPHGRVALLAAVVLALRTLPSFARLYNSSLARLPRLPGAPQVDSFVADWLTPLIAIFFKGTGDFSKASFEFRGSVFKYG